MPAYVPPDITIGQVPTGANLNTWLDGVATRTSAIDADQIDPNAKFPRTQFAQDAAEVVVPVQGYDNFGIGASEEYRFEAPTAGSVYRIGGYRNGGAASITVATPDSSVTLALLVGYNAYDLTAGEITAMTFARGDVITISIGAASVGFICFRFNQVGEVVG